MSLTVGELIAIPTLSTRVLAGRNGLDRKIHWAHSCELQEPWNWMGSGDLLMTIGHGFPPDERSQVSYLRNLAEGGLSGIVLAAGMSAPALTDGARHVAEQLAFPVLEAGYEIPFVTLARAVADSNQRESHLRLARVLRVYDAFRQAITRDDSDDAAFRHIASVIDTAMCIVDVTARTAELSVELALDDVELAAVMARIDEQRGRLPAVMRANAAGRHFIIQPLSDGQRWVLVTAVRDQIVDLAVLEHVATIMLVQLERRRSADLARLHSGGRLLINLTQGRADPGLAAAELSDLGLAGPPWRLSMARDGGANDLLAVQRRLLAAGMPHVLDRLHERIAVLTAEDVDTDLVAQALGDPSTRVGVSDVINSLSRIPEAVREARWAMEMLAAGDGVNSGRHTSLFLPRSAAEGHAVVTRVLGPLVDYDAEHDTNLVESLEVFFALERSWQTAAKQLCVHKQTLIYRMRRVEEITGRQLSHLEDVVELHLALRTRKVLRDA